MEDDVVHPVQTHLQANQNGAEPQIRVSTNAYYESTCFAPTVITDSEFDILIQIAQRRAAICEQLRAAVFGGDPAQVFQLAAEYFDIEISGLVKVN